MLGLIWIDDVLNIFDNEMIVKRGSFGSIVLAITMRFTILIESLIRRLFANFDICRSFFLNFSLAISFTRKTIKL